MINMYLDINSCIGLTEKLKEEAKKGYFIEIANFLKKEFDKQKVIYPPKNKVFSAFNFVKFEEIKVVILGQDPYHGPHEANGLAFSVDAGIKIPPSLRNIYKELSNDLHLSIPKHGDLRLWAEQGVLLLNSVLTVEENQPGSHAAIGWQQFTDRIIQALSEETEHLVFILWGNYAKSKINLINTQKHLVISSPHPSPFSANKGFLGSKPFSKANNYLVRNNKSAIQWELQ
jgi:uracil-DNA glycosylase